MKFSHLALKTLRLAIMRIGAGWMFALLTFNFNRISIYELGAMGVLITTLIGLHHFLSPVQVAWGRLADRYPLLGYRRGPYIILSILISSLVFLRLPDLAIRLGAGSLSAIIEAFGLFTIFGLAMAANGTSSNALMAEITTDKERGTVVAVVWTFLVLSSIMSAQVAKQIMQEYDPQQMQFLYNLTPFIAVGSALLGWAGLEQRIRSQAQTVVQPATGDLPAETGQNAFRQAWDLLQTNAQVRGFFGFILLAIMGIFLQDAILEVFGAEVFAMTPAETSTFQQFWGVGVLIGMFGIGYLSTRLPLSKKFIATAGGICVAFSLIVLAIASGALQREWLNPALLLMGLGIGVFNVGSLSMTMEMTVEGHVGFYMGLWGMAQGLGTGTANVLSGALHTGLIERQVLSAATAYTLIFTLEAVLMLLAIVVLRGISVQAFKGLDQADIQAAMALDAA